MTKVLIIAEAGVNHNGDIEMAKKLIDVAAEAGADIVKFQTFKAEKLVSKDAVKATYQMGNLAETDNSQYSMLKKLELDPAAHQILMDYCRAKSIQFNSTGFDLDSLDYLNSLGLEVFKIPSGEITNIPYLKKIASFGKKVILSTGMATMGEIELAIDTLLNAGLDRKNMVVLHCNTQYPTPMQDVNLKAMNAIKKAFKVAVGYSDHTLGIEVPIAAVALGAICIEKHFTLDRNLKGPDHQASLEPQELKAMVKSIRNIEVALGNGIKKPTVEESKNKNIVRKSIHLAKDLPAGHVLTASDLIMKRPGDGIPPAALSEVIGKQLQAKQPNDYKLNWRDLT